MKKHLVPMLVLSGVLGCDDSRDAPRPEEDAEVSSAAAEAGVRDANVGMAEDAAIPDSDAAEALADASASAAAAADTGVPGVDAGAPDLDGGAPDASPGSTQDSGGPPVGTDAAVPLPQHEFSQHACHARYSCAIDTQGRLYCWGSIPNRTASFSTPILVGTSTGHGHWNDWERIETGADDLCGLRGGGQLYCWGSNGILAQAQESAYPQPIRDWSGVRDVAVGHGTACAVLASGELHCWGSHAYGAVGVGNAPLESCNGDPCAQTPRRVGDGQEWTRVSADVTYFCGVRAGRVFCWGSSRLPNMPSSTGESCQPQDLTYSLACMRTPQPFFTEHDDWIDVEVREELVCARRQQGEYECRMISPDALDPSLSPERLAGYDQLSSAQRTTCGLKAGALWCWGVGDVGQLGDGQDRSDPGDCWPNACGPVEVVHPLRADWASVQTCSDHVCGLDASKHIFCWGNNYDEQLGVGDGDVPGVGPCENSFSCAKAPVALGPVEMCTPDNYSLACEPS